MQAGTSAPQAPRRLRAGTVAKTIDPSPPWAVRRRRRPRARERTEQLMNRRRRRIHLQPNLHQPLPRLDGRGARASPDPPPLPVPSPSTSSSRHLSHLRLPSRVRSPRSGGAASRRRPLHHVAQGPSSTIDTSSTLLAGTTLRCRALHDAAAGRHIPGFERRRPRPLLELELASRPGCLVTPPPVRFAPPRWRTNCAPPTRTARFTRRVVSRDLSNSRPTWTLESRPTRCGRAHAAPAQDSPPRSDELRAPTHVLEPHRCAISLRTGVRPTSTHPTVSSRSPHPPHLTPIRTPPSLSPPLPHSPSPSLDL